MLGDERLDYIVAFVPSPIFKHRVVPYPCLQYERNKCERPVTLILPHASKCPVHFQ